MNGVLPSETIRRYGDSCTPEMNVTIVKQLSFTARMSNSILAVREHVSSEDYRFNKERFSSCLLFALQYKFSGKSASAE
ncbi:MAG: hypothetical protein IPK08_07705 [Bacteroidetes bacterium]|nr:hypothetical protein [Bacteroidota bacterium]